VAAYIAGSSVLVLFGKLKGIAGMAPRTFVRLLVGSCGVGRSSQ